MLASFISQDRPLGFCAGFPSRHPAVHRVGELQGVWVAPEAWPPVAWA